MHVTFPHRYLIQSVKFWPVGMALDPQRSINGTQTAIPTLRGHWMASAQFVIHGEAATLEWEGFLAQMEGMIGTTLVPAWSRFRPKDRDGHPLAFCDIANLSDAQTVEHFGFENQNINHITVAADAALRATQIDINLNNSTGIRPGHKFSIGEHLYWCQVHWQPDTDTHRIMFTPPLRGAVNAGARVEVAKPVCRMRLIAEDGGTFDHSVNPLPSVTLTFEEAN